MTRIPATARAYCFNCRTDSTEPYCLSSCPRSGSYGAGMFFFPRDSISRRNCITLIEKAVQDGGFGLLGWRDVPH